MTHKRAVGSPIAKKYHKRDIAKSQLLLLDSDDNKLRVNGAFSDTSPERKNKFKMSSDLPR